MMLWSQPRQFAELKEVNKAAMLCYALLSAQDQEMRGLQAMSQNHYQSLQLKPT